VRLQTQPAEHLTPGGGLSHDALTVQEIYEPFGTDALAIAIDDINIATQDEASFPAEILGLAGGGHHAFLRIGNSHIADGRHNPSAVVGLLAIGLNVHHAIVADNGRIWWTWRGSWGRGETGRGAQRQRWQFGMSG